MKTIKRISKLQQAVEFLAQNFDKKVVVADIGTDHGYLAESLSKQNFIQKIIATDISEKSLSKLEKMIDKHGLSNIETRVGDGLDPVVNADISVIAGIGGWEIINILKTQNVTSEGRKKCAYFVLQPAQNVNELRAWLFDNKVCVLRDYVICDAERFYPILIVDVSKKQRNRKSVFNVWLGRDNVTSDEDFVLYLKDTKTFLEFLSGVSKKRIKKDKVLRDKTKLFKLINKLLKRCDIA